MRRPSWPLAPVTRITVFSLSGLGYGLHFRLSIDLEIAFNGEIFVAEFETMDRLHGMEVFIRVAEAGSFTAVADHLGVARSAVTRTSVSW